MNDITIKKETIEYALNLLNIQHDYIRKEKKGIPQNRQDAYYHGMYTMLETLLTQAFLMILSSYHMIVILITLLNIANLKQRRINRTKRGFSSFSLLCACFCAGGYQRRRKHTDEIRINESCLPCTFPAMLRSLVLFAIHENNLVRS